LSLAGKDEVFNFGGKTIIMENKKLYGVWIDSKQAFIIIFENESYKTETVFSTIEDFHPLGGSRSKVPWGPMEKISEKKYLERRKHQEQKYFEEIKKVIKSSKQVYLFGPAEMKDKLEDDLLNNNNFKNCTVEAESADSMTDRQKIAKAKDFFGLNEIPQT
jgi:hypothetical protein